MRLLCTLFLCLPGLLPAQTTAYPDSLRRLPDDSLKAERYLDFLADEFNAGREDTTLFEEGIALTRRIDNRILEAKFLGYYSTYYLNLEQYAPSEAKIRDAIAAITDRSPLLEWRMRYELAYLQMISGRLEAANLSATTLLRQAREMDNPRNIAKSALLLGQIAGLQENFSAAVAYDTLAVGQAYRSEHPYMIVHSLTQSAHHQVMRGDLERGEALANQALEVLPPDWIYEEYELRIVLGELYIARGDFEAARRQYERTGAISGDEADTATDLGLAITYQQLGQEAEARRLFHSLAAVELERDNANLLSDIYLHLSGYALSPTQRDTANHYRRLMTEWRDTLQSRANQAAALELEEQYAASERRAEIATQRNQLDRQRYQLLGLGGLALLAVGAGAVFYALLRKLRRRNAENERLVHQKEALIGEIHHRVKNNLQVISSLLQLQRQALADTTARGALQESQARVQAMGLIHQKLYQYEGLTTIPMQDYLRDLGESLIDAYRLDDRIDHFTDVEDIYLDVDIAIPLGLIINELVTNSLKYAFPGERDGTVEIQFHREADTYRLVVADDGVGRATPEEVAPSGTGFGTRLIDMLSRRLGATVRRLDGRGYRTEITFARP